MTARRAWLGLVAAVLAALLLWWGQSDEGATGTRTGDDPASASTTTPAPSAPTTSATSAPSTLPPTVGGTDPASGLRYVAVADLPSQAHDTLGLIDAGGPYPYDEDDGVFGNFEGLLPDHERGYYREYTVETPGLDHRGARRIVAGSAGELYWTEDHYQSFERIAR